MVPLTYFATIAWQVRHPAPIVGPAAESNSVDPIIYQIWLLSFVGFLLLMIGQALLSSEVYTSEERLAKLQNILDEKKKGEING